MAERRLRQYRITGSTLHDLGLRTIEQIDKALKAAGVVPRGAVATHQFVDAIYDVWVIRFKDSTFPPLSGEWDAVPTEAINLQRLQGVR